MGHAVFAIDEHPLSLHMPFHRKVRRFQGDMGSLFILPDGCIDVWMCLSVFEHLTVEVEERALHEALRVLVPGGRIVMTVDRVNPRILTESLASAGCQVGPVNYEHEQPLDPPVAWAIATTPCHC